MTTIEERAKAIVTENGRFPFDEYAHQRYIDLVQLATEQDSIARQEERERCIKAAQDAHCSFCPSYLFDCSLCKEKETIRKAMENNFV